MADLKLVGAVAIKVRPDATKFREETQRQVKQELAGVKPKIKVDADADTTGIKTDIEKAKKEVEAKRFKLKVDLDRASIKKAQAQVEAAMRHIDAKEIDVKLNKAGLAKAKAELAAMEKNAKVLITYANDTKGWEEVIARLEQIKREKITKTIEFGTDDASLESQIAYAKARIRNLGIDLHYTNDNASIQRAISEIDAQIAKIKEATLHTRLDEKSLLAARAELQAKLQDEPVTIKVDYDDQGSLKATRAKLDAMLSDLRSVDLKVKPDEESIMETRRRIDNLIQDENGQNVDLQVRPTGLALVAARLSYASRPRTVPFYVTVNKKSLAVAEGLMKSLAGINVLQKTGNFLENMISNFDKIAVAGAGWSALIASLADSLIYLVGATLSVGGGLAQMVGLLALAPTAFGVLASTMIIGQAVFKDFGRAVAGDIRSLNNLPPAGQKAARMMKGVWDQLRQDISQNFWDRAGTSMLKFVEHALPAFTKGLSTAATGLGAVFSGVLDSFTNLAITGGLKDMFKGLQGFFEEGARGATALWNALNTLGLNGASMLPKFGRWLSDISIQFDNWITAAHKAGDIQRWIDNGVRSLQSLWSAAGSTIDIFRALTRAFDNAGHTGLGGFANAMRRVADIMLGEPFQSQISNIFEGARKGASGLNAGIRDLGRAFMDSNRYVGAMLQGLGQLAGDVVSALALVFSNPHFQSGTLNALRGMRDAMDHMTPGFQHLGDTIGHLGDIAGAVFTGLAPIMNKVSSMLSESFSTVGDNLVKIVPQLMSLIGGFLTTFNGPLQLIIEGLNAILGIVNSMPGPLKSVTVALVAMLLLRGQFASFFTALDNGWRRMNASAGNGVAQDGVLRRLRDAWSMTATSVVRDGERMPPRGIATRFAALGSAVGRVGVGIAGSIKMAFLGLTGGWIGAAVIAIGVAFAVLGQKAADAQAKIDELQTTLDKAGSITNETIQANAKTLNDAKINLFTNNPGTHSPSETIKILGKSIQETAAIATKGGAAYRDMLKILSDGQQAIVDATDHQTGYGVELAKNKNAMQEWADANGITGDISKLTAEDLSVLKDTLLGINSGTEAATTAWAHLNDALAPTSQRVQDFDTAMQKLRDTTADMPSRIQAFKDAMDVLNGKVRTTEEISKSYNTAVSDMGDFLAAAAKNGESFNGVIDKSTGKINTVSRLGQNLDTQLHNLSGQEIGIVIDMQQKGAKPEEITKELERAKQAWIDQAKQAGISAPEAAKAWDHAMQGLPKEVTTVITAEGVDKAGTDVKTYKEVLANLDGTRAITHLLADDSDATEKILLSTGNVEAFNNLVATATAKLDPTEAEAVREKIITELANMAALDPTVKAHLDPRLLEDERTRVVARLVELGHMKPTPQVDANIDQAQRELNAIDRALATTDSKRPRPRVSADTGSADSSLRYVDGILTMVAGRRPRPIVTADVGQATSAISYVMGLLNDVDGRVARSYIETRVTTINDVINHVATGPGGRGGITAGGRNGWLSGSKFQPEIVKFFANGGLHYERPGNAKIFAPASTARVFAEPVTGGEAYIPMSISKRARSEKILGEVAHRFGFEITKAQQFANGTPVAPNGPSVDAQVHIGTINTVDPQSAVRELQQKRRDALALAGRPL